MLTILLLNSKHQHHSGKDKHNTHRKDKKPAHDAVRASTLLTKYLEELPIGYERSFLKISNAAQTADYEHPWRGMEPAKWSGSGFVLEYAEYHALK